MSTSFQIIPHRGIGPLLLGSKQADVRAAMASLGYGTNAPAGAEDYFCENCVQVTYSTDGTVDFIGINSAPPFSVIYAGVEVFSVSAQELFELMARSEAGTHDFESSEYLFRDQILALWDADEQYDHRSTGVGAVWGQVALGDRRYLAAIDAIHAGD